MPGPPSRENATAAANRPGSTPVSGEKVIAATRPNPPSRENIVAALRKLIEGLDTEDKYDVCLNKVRTPSHHIVSEQDKTLTGHMTDAQPSTWPICLTLYTPVTLVMPLQK